MKIAGVYKITNNITGDFYIGSSENIKHRWANHKSCSSWKNQPNFKLYKDMAQYGLGNFIFEVLEETSSLREREQYWIEYLKPAYNDRYAKGLNTERCKEAHKQCCKEWYKVNRDEQLAKNKAYHYNHRDENLAKSKAYRSRLCFYEGKTLTLNALRNRFTQQGIPHPTLEAQKYLIERSINDELI